ncbi:MULTISPECIES: HNH endonuclease [Morganellaceae]|uniref:HNH nuclease domain-containing protein n=3 Tax=Morganellaceae TaxID=1903414 RepID=A0A1B8HMU5_9GAMM|nr:MULTISPECIES: HNH endonuclease [Morganellaceae]OBU10590.1 hypothetical protein AYY17_15740 [Morganella psychrotolerans]QCJ72264.1 HNH endonuclease [Providencia heimbachae]UNH29095.1 HNH endonuclease [Moellerella wisconsensis]UNH32635.1 HNH endonuclease [Moellerella wisconsensis]UNH40676.1 HNH endonuclease [Moellerella wisconsensis]
MAFPPKISQQLALNSAYICNNPDCYCLTIGPSLVEEIKKIKTGEGAHIAGEKEGSARHIDGNKNSNEIENGIWLCANCHTAIDKNNGIDFPPELLAEWKLKFRERLFGMILSHESSMPLVLRYTKNYKLLSDLIDFMEDKGVYYLPEAFEFPPHCIESMKETRNFITDLKKKVIFDSSIKKILSDISGAIGRAMNMTSKTGANAIIFGDCLKAMRHELTFYFNEIEKLGINVPSKLKVF